MFYRNGLTLLKVSKTLLLNGFAKRLQHTHPEKGESFYKRWIEYIRVYGMDGQSAAFRSFIVSRYHRVDKIDASKWNIIYHDFVASRLSVIGTISITCVGVGLAFSISDYYINGKLTSKRGMQWQRDFEELGAFAYIILSGMILCGICLIRLQLLRILRIYQSKSNPEDFVMIRAGVSRFNKKTPFTRSQVKILSVLYDQEAYYYQIFAFGNIKIHNRSAIINTESFEQPAIKSYMFGERNTIPEKLLSPSASSKKSQMAKSKKIPPPPMF
uniref:Uncharacterized protein n=1 Tax=Panagrolaimus superbus TaxID=310955 RepID=A0A914ZH16_9BILA